MLKDDDIKNLYTHVVIKNMAALAAIQVLMDKGKIMPLAESAAAMESTWRHARAQYEQLSIRELMALSTKLMAHE